MSIFNQFNDPLKFWNHQLSFKDNQKADLEKPLYDECEAAAIMKGFLNGLNNIHEQNYIHRDIKPENIQLAPDGQSQEKDLKIIDFGLSAKQRVGVKLTHQEKIGTILFMAPEQISSKSYSKKIDIYSAGIVLYMMLCGYHPLYVTGGFLCDNAHTLK